MNQQPTQFNRFRVMSALALAVLGVYLVVLFNIQVVHHDDYLAQSTQAIARVEDVKASRGIITDRSGRTLVSNQYTYSLTFDTSLLKNGADQNEAILRLVQLCREQNVEWDDNLPLSYGTPFTFTVDDGSRGDLVQEASWKGGECTFRFRKVRPIPEDDDFFENVWRSYRETGNIY